MNALYCPTTTKRASVSFSRTTSKRTYSSTPTALERAGISGLREGQEVKFDKESTAVATIEIA
jgi:hypothetical protein